ncbi:MAG: GTP cyclohydrolase I FolE [SAR324 cluster bacterium]|nr:GTP cyclohydrolase I FolE [SAR324 cluster bacterium]
MSRLPEELNRSFEEFESLGDCHHSTSLETPMRADAWELSSETKIQRIEEHFREIMQTLGLDLTDDSLQGTPRRVAKMLVSEIFSGLNPEKKPEIRLFQNTYRYQNILLEKSISFRSFCEHHFLPVIGEAHVAYIPKNGVIGLSKINRIVDYYAKRPQVQERLTRQIAEELEQALGTPDVAVLLDAKHFCVMMRGIEDQTSSTTTAEYRGCFQEAERKNEFLRYIYSKNLPT